MELESDDADQAFFKAKHPGERRFSIDTYRESNSGGQRSESYSDVALGLRAEQRILTAQRNLRQRGFHPSKVTIQRLRKI